MIETQYITLDMKPSGVLPVLYCSQYDIGRPLGMVVYNGGEVVDLSGYTVTIEATRTDGAAITAAVTTSGNIGAFETTATMTNKADSYGAQLVLSAFGKRVASLPFVMVVVKAAMDENAESIEEDKSLYQQYTETVQTLIEAIQAQIDEIEAQGEWYITPQVYGAVGDGVTDDTAAIQRAINENKCVVFPYGEYLVTAPIEVTHQVKVIGVGNRNSTLKTASDIPIFKISDTVSDAFTIGNSVFEELGFKSVGGTYGTNALGYGILFGDLENASSIMNIPWVRVKNCRFSGFKTGLYLEGYGHSITGSYFSSSETGVELIHPEQVLLDNSWFEYCNVGLKVNNTKNGYGHNMQLIGGAVQRCNYGAKIFNFYEPSIITYCEQNKYSDFEFGDSANPTDYSRGCKNIKLYYNTTGEDSNNTNTRQYCIGLYAAVGADIDIFNYSSYAGNNTPNVYANAYSKYLRIHAHSESLGQSNALYSIDGDSGRSTYIDLDGNQQYTPNRSSTTYKVQYTDGINEPFAVESLEYQGGSTKRKIEYTNSGENIYMSKTANSQLSVFDSSDSSLLFAILNNPSANYRHIRVGIPIAFLDSSDNAYKPVRVNGNQMQMYYGGSWKSVMLIKEASDNTYHDLRLNNGVLQYYTNGAWTNVKATSAT